MSNAVPEGWAIQPLNGKVEILSGYPFQSSLFCDDPSKMGVIRIRDLVKQSVETFYAGDFDDQYVVRRGDILIGMDGDFNIVKWKTKNALLNQRICKVKASKGGGFNSDFLFYSLVDDLDSIHAATGATTVKHLSVKDIKGIEKAYPPLPEQQKIAAILSSVDNVIEKTRAQIDKLKDLKTGMMQELLTKGIGSGGVPHTEFKDSPVGRIPASWGASALNELVAIKHGYAFEGEHFRSSPTPYLLLTPGNFNKDGRLYFGPKTKYYDGPVPDEFILDNGDVLVVMTDLTKEMAILGNTIILKSPRTVLHNQRIGKVTILREKDLLPEYLCFVMNSDRVKGHIKDTATGTTVRHTSPTKILEPLIPVPPIEEQKKIMNIFQTVDDRLTVVESKLASYEKIKKALMQDLLTGKVRVKVDQKESAVA